MNNIDATIRFIARRLASEHYCTTHTEHQATSTAIQHYVDENWRLFVNAAAAEYRADARRQRPTGQYGAVYVHQFNEAAQASVMISFPNHGIKTMTAEELRETANTLNQLAEALSGENDATGKPRSFTATFDHTKMQGGSGGSTHPMTMIDRAEFDDYQRGKRTAANLAVTLAHKHWPITAANDFELANDLHGIILQIDNMTAGLVREQEPQPYSKIALETIADVVQSWLEWSKSERDKEGLTTEAGTNIMSLPVPYWPDHTTLSNWCAALRGQPISVNHIMPPEWEYVVHLRPPQHTINTLHTFQPMQPPYTYYCTVCGYEENNAERHTASPIHPGDYLKPTEK